MNLLTTLLITLFTVFLLLLAAALTYVILRRIRFHRRSLHPNEEPAQPDQPSKELLYFLCWQNQNPSRIKPTTTATATAPPLPPPPTEDDDTLAKWHLGFFHEGPSRLLFTIKEEEREGTESGVSDDRQVMKYLRSKSVSLEEFFVPENTDWVIENLDDESESDDGVTPFSTPSCGSPIYYTPSPSPAREFEVGV